MANTNHPSRPLILKRQETLNQARITLKSEFVGIDSIIDEIIESISSWYIFPDLQERPVIVNLWGLTGVGKTALINRLVDLLDFNEKFFSFDLGAEESKKDLIKNSLDKLNSNYNGYPIIIAFDEFQNARSLNSYGDEKDTKNLSIVWQLLDSGKFQSSKFDFFSFRLNEYIQTLQLTLLRGVQVLNGEVTKNKRKYLEVVYNEDKSSLDKLTEDEIQQRTYLFVPSEWLETIYNLSTKQFPTVIELEEKLAQLSGPETITLLSNIFISSLSQKSVDCSKGLIFVLGNLDEAYAMNSNFNADIDADAFHEISLGITVPIIKNALKKLFRSEQISRLGNTHIIYPAMSTKTFQGLIQLELNKIHNKIATKYQLDMVFDASIHELIFTEGVYPTQGARPVLTTIHQIIKTKLSRIVSEVFLYELTATTIKLRVIGEFINVQYLNEDKVIHAIQIHQPRTLGKLRESKKDDTQSIIAVHESGHAILSCVLEDTLPEAIYSVTTTGNFGGLTYSKPSTQFTSKKDIVNTLAVFFGGMAAEAEVFGAENITNGSNIDIKMATELATDMLKEYGMGAIPAAYQAESFQTVNFVYDVDHKINREVELLLQSAYNIATKTLKEYRVLLLMMSDFLSDHRMLSKSQIIDLIKQYAPDLLSEQLLRGGSLGFYRNQLKQQVRSSTQSTLEFIPKRATG